jgi:hypothetical protein
MVKCVRRLALLAGAGGRVLLVVVAVAAACTGRNARSGDAPGPLRRVTTSASSPPDAQPSGRIEIVEGVWHFVRRSAGEATVVVAVGGCLSFDRAEVTGNRLVVYMRRTIPGPDESCTGELGALRVDVPLPAGFQGDPVGSCTPDDTTPDGRTCRFLVTVAELGTP